MDCTRLNFALDAQGQELDPSELPAHFERIRKWKDSQIRAIHEKREPHHRSEDGFLSRLAKKVRDSLQIKIHNFSIRYSDRRSSDSNVSDKSSPSHKGEQSGACQLSHSSFLTGTDCVLPVHRLGLLSVWDWASSSPCRPELPMPRTTPARIISSRPNMTRAPRNPSKSRGCTSI